MTGVLVVVPAYNCYQFLVQALASVKAQVYDDMRVVVVDDCSDDERQRDLVESVSKFDGWKGIVNEERRKCPRNLWDAIRVASPNWDDVVVLLDGDDWFPHRDCVSRIVHEYEMGGDACLLTYGSYESRPFDEMCHPAEPYPLEIIQDRSFRGSQTLYNHPLSFRFMLWDQLTESDLTYPTGEWFGACYDQAIMYPMLEMAGPNHRFIPDPIYVYRSDSPAHEAIIERPESERVATELLARPKKPRMRLDEDRRMLVPVELSD